MSAYVIVDIDVHDPVGYEDYKHLRRRAWLPTAAGTWRAAGRSRHSKATGRPAAW